MKKNILLTTLLFAVSLGLFSQNDWRSGYVLRTKTDTLYGLINYRSSVKNKDECQFKTSDKVEKEVFVPGEIYGYRYQDSKFYISKSITTGDSSKLYFVEFLIEGKANIFYMRDDNLDRYFVEKDTIIHELKNTVDYTMVQGIQYSKERNEFQGVLGYVFEDAHMSSDIQKGQLNHPSLIKLSKKYHETVCDEYQCVVYERPVNKISVDIGLIAGQNNKYLDLEYTLVSNLQNERSYFLGIGVNIHNINMLSDKVSFQIDFLSYKYSLVTEPFVYANRVVMRRIDKEKLLLNVPLLCKYQFLSYKVTPTIEMGISNYFYFKEGNSKYSTLFLGLGMDFKLLKSMRINANYRVELKPQLNRFVVGVWL